MPEIIALTAHEPEDKPPLIMENAHDSVLGVHQARKLAADTLTLVRSMLALVACIQRHRGATMALLGGDDRFAERMPHLQKEIALRIDLLMLEPDPVVDRNDKDNILSAWKTIAHNWQDDAVLENFEYHSHLIEYLLRMVRARGELYLESLNRLGSLITDPEMLRNLGVLKFIACNNVPDCFELLAKLRGLATHAAASHQCDAMTQGRIEFLLKELARLTGVFDGKVRELTVRLQEKLVPGNTLAQAKVKRDYLVELMSNDIVEGKAITLDSEMVYRVTTEVIDTYYAYSYAILSYLQSSLPDLVNHCMTNLAKDPALGDAP
ncbi:MAG: hypothetical protein R3208_21025 [Ketobacteraceae bacterium]|nr:hypothetical protein [Ketobacteraceae bacterium]